MRLSQLLYLSILFASSIALADTNSSVENPNWLTTYYTQSQQDEEAEIDELIQDIDDEQIQQTLDSIDAASSMQTSGITTTNDGLSTSVPSFEYGEQQDVTRGTRSRAGSQYKPHEVSVDSGFGSALDQSISQSPLMQYDPPAQQTQQNTLSDAELYGASGGSSSPYNGFTTQPYQNTGDFTVSEDYDIQTSMSTEDEEAAIAELGIGSDSSILDSASGYDLSTDLQESTQTTYHGLLSVISNYLPATDYSLGYLKQLFGDFDGMFNSNVPDSFGASVIGELFRVFNSWMLVFAVVILMYIVFIGTLTTAHEGKVMGEWKSLWIPLRAALAVAMLVPQAGGYCLAQKLVMYIVLAGVAAANMMWSTAVDKLVNEKTIYSMSALSINQPAAMSAIYPVIIAMYEQQACAIKLSHTNDNGEITPHEYPHTTKEGYIKVYNPKTQINLGGVLDRPSTQVDPNSKIINYNEKATNPKKPICGGLKWTLPTKKIPDGQGGYRTEIDDVFNKKIINTMKNIYDNLKGASSLAANDGKGGEKTNDEGETVCGKDNVVAKYGCVVKSIQDYNALLYSGNSNTDTDNVADSTETIRNHIKHAGWADAGEYFYELAKWDHAEKRSLSISSTKMYVVEDKDNKRDFDTIKAAISDYIATSDDQVHQYTVDSYNHDESTLLDQYKKPKYDIKYDFDSKMMSGFTRTLFDIFTFGMAALVESWNKTLVYSLWGKIEDNTAADNTGPANPILMLQQLGRAQLTGVMDIWINGLLLIEGLTIAGGVASAIGAVPGFGTLAEGASVIMKGMSSMITWLQGMTAPLMIIIFGSGFLLSIWIPFMPYILSLLCVFGWVLSVIEMMVAAPIVALGVIAPEGHDVFGQARPAILLSFGLFMRPMLMIFGFVIAMIAIYIGSAVINMGFLNMVASVFNSKLGLLSGLGVIMIYSLVMTILCNKSFGLMTELSNRVLRWIGGQHATFEQGEQQSLGEVKSGTEPLGRAGGEGLQKLSSSGTAGSALIEKGGKYIGNKKGGGGVKTE